MILSIIFYISILFDILFFIINYFIGIDMYINITIYAISIIFFILKSHYRTIHSKFSYISQTEYNRWLTDFAKDFNKRIEISKKSESGIH
jgi:hypothetical protein